jgi:hypothetical protein
VAIPSSPSQRAAGRRINALVKQQSLHDSDMAVSSSPLDGIVVIGRRIEHRVSKQTIDDVDMAVLSGFNKGAVHISVSADKQLARFEGLLHVRQSTMGSVITE